MPIIFVFVLSMFWCGVQASQLSLNTLNEEATIPVRTEAVCDLNTLKHQRHNLRSRLLNRVRTPSISPPAGDRRRKMEEDLLHIETMLKEFHTEF